MKGPVDHNYDTLVQPTPGRLYQHMTKNALDKWKDMVVDQWCRDEVTVEAYDKECTEIFSLFQALDVGSCVPSSNQIIGSSGSSKTN